jgi:hypothetical protein
MSGDLKRALDAPRWLVWGSRTVLRSARELVTMFRGGGLADAIEPWMRIDRVDDVPFDEIAASGAKAVLFDLENTIIPPGGPFDDAGRTIIGKARAAGLHVGVERVRGLGRPGPRGGGHPRDRAGRETCQAGVPRRMPDGRRRAA